MKCIFWIRPEQALLRSDWRETNLARAIQKGAAVHGDEVIIKDYDGTPRVESCDMVLGIGVKRRDLFKAYRAEGISYCYFDKGYDRHRANVWLDYWRVSTNGHQPMRYVEIAKHDSQRSDDQRVQLKPRQHVKNGVILLDGSSKKHYYFHDMPDPDLVARETVKKIQAITKRPIVYRPKPSYRLARPIPGTEWARGRPGVHDKDNGYDLKRSHVVVTYGSNLCFDAVAAGIPAIVLGEGISKCVSSTKLEDIENPYFPPEDKRKQWINNCAWCQFKNEEYESGLAWPIIRAMEECSR